MISIAFVDSTFSLLSASAVKSRIVIYSSRLKLDIGSISRLFFGSQICFIRLNQLIYRLLTLLISHLPVPVYISACRYRPTSSSLVSFLPDGQLTHILLKKKLLPRSRFVPVSYVIKEISKHPHDLTVNTAFKLIIGSNWVEFGCMSAKSYELYLSRLHSFFPDFYYKPHPFEDPSIASRYFRIIETSSPL